MPETESRTQRIRGPSPPNRPDWAVSTVCRCGTNLDGTAICPVTGADVALDEVHFYVTLHNETISAVQPDEFDHFVVADGAFGELEQLLEDE
ncbi:hypothetical protein [Natrialba sp. INN-245]|uniref:hypothetical protein n=1 Tax=Natrialba sp. INN-245 TaxID=2690967 RepID=UPI001310E4C0|nr:hypothetical protein [Natrialba sp. INN-245]MWV41055.1 hypothetical protein [Natrialba sp. INN-245]